MKKTFLSGCIALLCFGLTAMAQTPQLWGTVYSSSKRDSAVIFKINADGSGFAKLDTFYSKSAVTGFSRISGAMAGNLLKASNGKIYIVNSESVLYTRGHYGSIICYDPASHSYTVVHQFKLTEGAVPQGSLIQAKDGKLYGMTAWGGTHNYGVIFSINISGNSYADLYDLDSSGGFYSKGKLMQAADGKLYGMTEHGGKFNDGVIFSFNPSDSSYKKLFDFDGINGKYPTGNLTQAGNGLLYGMTGNGGVHNKRTDYPDGDGVIFSIDPANGVFTKLHDLDSADGVNPWGSLTLADNGKLYGATYQAGANNNGTIFCYDVVKNSFSKLYDFDPAKGGGCGCILLLLNKGKLYGTASWGGANYFGVVFSFDLSNNQYKELYDFDGVSASNPFGDLILVQNNSNNILSAK